MTSATPLTAASTAAGMGRPPSFVIGLDLGQAQDYSAVAVVEHSLAPDPEGGGGRVSACAVRHLHRWPLGTPYTAVVADVAALLRRPPLPGAALVVDATGVGRAVADLFRRAGLPGPLVPLTIHGGHAVTAEAGGGWSVPKKDLVAVMTALVEGRRFQVAEALPDAAALSRELLGFRVKVTAAGHESFGAWRERDHDDLVLAVACACWFAVRCRASPGR
jgi:hypothetical protein